MKNHAASVHARLAQRRTKTGEDYNVVFEQEWEISLECQPIGIWPKNALESGDKPDGVPDSRLVESLRSP
jgi:hypothetical protein